MTDERKPTASRFSCWRYPELRRVRSRKELCEIRRAAANQTVGVIALGGFALLVVSSLVGVAVGSMAAGFLPLWTSFPAGLAISLPGGFLLIWCADRRTRFIYRRLMQEKGIPICIKCGYDLAGQTEPRCPECGEAFDPELLKAQAPPPSPED